MRALIALMSLVVTLAAGPAYGQSAASRCRIRTLDIDFGIYSTLATAPDTNTGTIMLTCVPTALAETARIALSPGRSGRFLDRTLTRGGEVLHYNLYADPAHQLIVGDGSNGTVRPLSIRGRGASVFRIYGVLPPRQAVPAGEYSDTLRIVVEF